MHDHVPFKLFKNNDNNNILPEKDVHEIYEKLNLIFQDDLKILEKQYKLQSNSINRILGKGHLII